jgi:hypothetical protein
MVVGVLSTCHVAKLRTFLTTLLNLIYKILTVSRTASRQISTGRTDTHFRFWPLAMAANEVDVIRGHWRQYFPGAEFNEKDEKVFVCLHLLKFFNSSGSALLKPHV